MPHSKHNSRIRYAELVDVAGLQTLTDSFQQVLGIANAIIDMDGVVLAQSGWQELCFQFHRRHPETLHRCIESDTSLAQNLLEGQSYAVYRCLNGLVDTAAPIIVAGEHVANVFTGQFFSSPPDWDFFRRQAHELGFDEAAYLKAVAKVPILPPERVEAITRLYAQLAKLLGEQALQRLHLQSAAEELKDCSLSLEQRVKERTGELHEAQQQLQALLDSAPIGIGWTDAEGKIEYVNRHFTELFGYTLEDIPTQEDWYRRACPDEHYRREVVARWSRDVTRARSDTAVVPQVEASITGKIGDRHRVLIRGAWVGERLLVNFSDITERWLIEQREASRNQLLEMIARGVQLPLVLRAIALRVEEERPNLACSILLLDTDGRHLLNGAAPSLPDFYNEAVHGLAIGPTVGSCGSAAYTGERVIVEDIQNHPNWAPYTELARRAGLAACWSEPVRSSDGEMLGTLALYANTPSTPSAADIILIEYAANLASIAIEHHRARDELERRAHLDYLTGLANRRYFLQQAELALAGALRYRRALSILMLDIDRFKAINDTHGHKTGDLALQKLSEVCRQVLRKVDLIGRWGGEEFAVLLPETEGQSAFEGAERLRQALAASEMALPCGRSLRFTASIGLATLTPQDTTLDTLIQRADQALYAAKREGRNQVCWAHGVADFTFLPEERYTRPIAEQERNAARYARAIETSMDGYLLADARGRLLEVNEALCQLTGYTRAELLNMAATNLKDGGTASDMASRLAAVAAQGKVRFDSRWRCKNGEPIDVEISATYVDEDGGLYFAFVRNVTPIRQAQQRVRRITHLYAFLSHANAAIIRGNQPQTLLAELCRIAVEDGGFGLVWIGMRNPANDDVEPVAWFGQASHYLQSIRLSASADIPQGRGPTGIAIREGHPVVVNDFLADPLTAWWRDIAREHGLRASATFPLQQGQTVVGAIMFYATEAGYFDEERVDLLAELAGDISFALDLAQSEQQRSAADEALLAKTEELNRFFDVTLDLLCIANMDGFFQRVNHAWETTLGYRPEELEGRRFLDFIHPDDIPATLDAVAKQARGERVAKFVNRYRHKDGGFRSIEWQSVAVGSQLFAAAQDITDRLRSDAHLQLAGRVFDAAHESILVTDAEQRLVAVNPAFTAMNGYTEAEILGQNPRILKSGLQAQAFYAAMWEAITEHGYWHGELWNRRKNGELYLALATISEVRDAAQKLTHYVALETDISAMKEAEQRIDYLAYYDPLTDLPNRALLAQRAELALALAQRHHEHLAVLFLDLDRFKEVNDSLGHEAGDAMLIQVARRLQAIVRDTDTMCRLGGDEFLLLLPGECHDGALEAAQKIQCALQSPVTVAQRDFNVTAAIGIAIYPQDGVTIGELMKNAEAAMYQAKRENFNATAFYNPAMNQTTLDRLLLEAELRKAIQAGQLRTHYQPKIRLQDGQVIGAEALVRWQHPEQGLIPPGRFIPIAEASGLINAIGDWVLGDVANQLTQWRQQGLPPLTVAVNLAARHFHDPRLPAQLAELLSAYGLPADALELELTESTLLDAGESVLQTLRELRALGLTLAIDDFGTGYSSLSYLKRFPIEIIKIDQSFVRDLVTDPEDRALALSIIALGHSLGLQVVAEGVETEEQRAILLEQGCDLAQGYWFSRPLPAEQFAEWWLKALEPRSDNGHAAVPFPL